ncbi:hypothetical protein DL764_000040 [Monosporascus ibericus]|uniref:Uncharacterized protein n=1 Tax=Monosporascus ibericus TaxID=155417 RepID=A0A4Q4TV25_9PEZI|nr:hypothetical protein DL764_000040 [Monosporascus ibericus]
MVGDAEGLVCKLLLRHPAVVNTSLPLVAADLPCAKRQHRRHDQTPNSLGSDDMSRDTITCLSTLPCTAPDARSSPSGDGVPPRYGTAGAGGAIPAWSLWTTDAFRSTPPRGPRSRWREASGVVAGVEARRRRFAAGGSGRRAGRSGPLLMFAVRERGEQERRGARQTGDQKARGLEKRVTATRRLRGTTPCVGLRCPLAGAMPPALFLPINAKGCEGYKA